MRVETKALMAHQAEKKVYQSGHAVPIDHAGNPHGGVRCRVSGIDGRGGQPPGETPSSQEKVGLRTFAQAVKENPAQDHQHQKQSEPDPVENGENHQSHVLKAPHRRVRWDALTRKSGDNACRCCVLSLALHGTIF